MRTTWAAAAAVAALMLVGLAAAGCSSAPERRSPAASYERVDCPDDVEVLVVPKHECGFVTPDPDDALRIFVVAIEPPQPSNLSPVLETGVDLGMAPAYGGLAPIAQRTGRRVVIVDLPGTGHSVPSLDCPQVEALGALADEPQVAEAVAECRRQVEASGGRSDLVTPARLGEAMYAVMEALDEPTWVVMGHGTTAEAGRQVALAHPDRVEALVVDSLVTDPDADIAQVVAGIAEECRTDADCLRAHGDPENRWRAALRRLDRRPVVVEVPGDQPTEVTIDADVLERAVRWLVAPVGNPALLPAMLAEAAAGTPAQHLGLFAATMSAAPPLCVGYVPKCETEQRLVIGTTLSAMCPAVAASDNWSGVCEAWGVPTSSDEVQPLTDVPTLALLGAHDPFGKPDVIRARLAQLVPDAFVVEYRAGAHNVLGAECPREVRNEWLAGDVNDPPPDLPCLSAPIDFS